MEITSKGIKLDRELSALDKFVIEFSNAISKHTKYVIVSGYVSILLGRSRSSEDVDMLVSEMPENEWRKTHEELEKEGFHCINVGAQESYSYIKDDAAPRFAMEGKAIPNMEILFAKSIIQKLALENSIQVTIGKSKINISNLELQIAYKEKILGSSKDIEDARHLRQILGKGINLEKLKEYEVIIDAAK